jgi:hypothetical protein
MLDSNWKLVVAGDIGLDVVAIKALYSWKSSPVLIPWQLPHLRPPSYKKSLHNSSEGLVCMHDV